VIDVAAATAAMVDTLTAAGIAACLDLRDMETPGVYVPSPDLEFGIGKATARWRIVAAAANTGRSAALAELGPLIGAVNTALGGGVVAARPVDLTSIDGTGPRPGYELSFTTRIRDTP
jgi:hypothetical protein